MLGEVAKPRVFPEARAERALEGPCDVVLVAKVQQRNDVIGKVAQITGRGRGRTAGGTRKSRWPEVDAPDAATKDMIFQPSSRTMPPHVEVRSGHQVNAAKDPETCGRSGGCQQPAASKDLHEGPATARGARRPCRVR